MSEDLRSALTAALDDDAGDTDQPTPEREPEAAITETTEPEPVGDTAPAATPEDEALFNSAEFLAAHPELTPYAKQLQGDYTKKTQQLAEQRKQFEGMSPDTLAWAKRLEQTAAVDPQAALQMIAEVQAQLQGASAPQPEPPAEPEWMTDTERLLAERLAKVESFSLQQQAAANEAMATRLFGDLAKKFGLEDIPHDQKYQVIQRMQQRHAPLEEIPVYWGGMYGIEMAMQRGRDEGARSVAAKNGIGPPPRAVVPGTGPPPEPKSLREALEMLPNDE